MSGLTKKIIAIASASAFVSGAAIAADLTVVSWGGAYTKSQVEAYHKPWMAKTGKAIVSEDYGGGIAEIKAPKWRQSINRARRNGARLRSTQSDIVGCRRQKSGISGP